MVKIVNRDIRTGFINLTINDEGDVVLSINEAWVHYHARERYDDDEYDFEKDETMEMRNEMELIFTGFVVDLDKILNGTENSNIVDLYNDLIGSYANIFRKSDDEDDEEDDKSD